METALLQEPLKCKRGQTYDETFEFLDENDQPVDISAKTPSLALRSSNIKEDPAEATATCTIINPNKVRVVIAATLTANLKPRIYKTDLRLAEGSIVDYAFEGDFLIEEAITRS